MPGTYVVARSLFSFQLLIVCNVFFIWFPFTVPQILALLADQNLPADVEANMNAVTYSSRFAVALFFDQSPDFINLGSGVCAKYFDGDDVMRYMSVDSLKRNCGESNY